MARKPRFYAPGIAYYVAQYVDDQNLCFRKDDDYRQCLNYMLDSSLDYNCDIHAYALLPHGIQLVIVPGEEQGIPRFMQSLSRRYVAYFNHKYHRRGPLWKRRYKAGAVDATDYLIQVCQYIEHRPVQLGCVETPQAYPWSSYHSNALGLSDGITSCHPAYVQLGADAKQRRMRYIRLANVPLNPVTQQNIERCLALGLPLGSSNFKQELATTLNVQPASLYPGHHFERHIPVDQQKRDYSKSA